jgi:predicted DsbA family dithiol-disulfide isomerase
MTIRIDVISDVVCPWCYIGKRNLEAALAMYGAERAAAVSIHWQPFELNPQLPSTGMDRSEYLARKFGGAERAQQIYARVAAAGKAAGLDFAFHKIVRQPNTFDAHRVVAFAERMGRQSEVVEALFNNYFLRGTDLTQHANLVDIASEAGLDSARVTEHLEGEADKAQVRDRERWARELGVDGVPYFLINQRYAVVGAQPPEVILRALSESSAKEKIV